MRPTITDYSRRERLLAIALLWLATGSALLLSTVVPAHTVLLGWAPLVCLLAAPLVVLLVLEPGPPRQGLAQRQAHRGHPWRRA